MHKIIKTSALLENIYKCAITELVFQLDSSVTFQARFSSISWGIRIHIVFRH